ATTGAAPAALPASAGGLLRAAARVARERVRPGTGLCLCRRTASALTARLVACALRASRRGLGRLRLGAALCELGLRVCAALLAVPLSIRALLARVLPPLGSLLLRILGAIATLLSHVFAVVRPVFASIFAVVVVIVPRVVVHVSAAVPAVRTVVVVVVDGCADR